MNVVIVVPVYKNIPDENEVKSLERCAKIFSSRKISLVCPKSLDYSFYKQIFKNNNLSITRFKDSYFKSVSSYSKLLLSSFFYEAFSEYDYMLIYQPDSWVFNDDLDFWCACGYSYIGAPWFNNGNLSDIAGNGGFSLRKIPDMIELFNSNVNLKFLPRDFYRIFCKRLNLFSFLWCCVLYLYHLFFPLNFWKHTKLNEDYAIVKYANFIDADFKIAQPNMALKFSFEMFPELLFVMNEYKLPFGCHGYLKHGIDFWKNYM